MKNETNNLHLVILTMDGEYYSCWATTDAKEAAAEVDRCRDAIADDGHYEKARIFVRKIEIPEDDHSGWGLCLLAGGVKKTILSNHLYVREPDQQTGMMAMSPTEEGDAS